MIWLCLILVFVSSFVIAYQDFKTRLINIWWIVCFGIASISHYALTHSFGGLFENIIFCFVYLLFSYLILHLFYFVKTKKFQKILDSKIGWGDVFLVVLIGTCLSPLTMIYFFTFVFVVTLIFQLVFQKQSKNIALGAMLVICYSIYIIIDVFRIIFEAP